jgi:glycerophosphoryl diester phosphodiesterase
VVAHRAGNHEASLRRACALGADLIEADVRWHRGRMEVRHLKSMGRVPLLWDKWLLAPGWTKRLLLAELLATAPPDCELMLDLKGGHPHDPREVLAAIRRDLPGREYTVCSQHWHLLGPFHGEPGARVVHSIGNARMLQGVRPHLERHAGDAVSIHKRLLNPASVKDLLERVSLIMTWPVNDERELRQLQAWGVNGFIIDDLALAARVVQSRMT